MRYLFLFILILLVHLVSCKNSTSYDPIPLKKIDSIYIYWNNATIESIYSHIKVATDTTERKFYLNRSESFKAGLKYENGNTVDSTSIRHRFLRTVFGFNGAKDDFYILESQISGEKITLINYLIVPLDSTNIEMDIYNYQDEKWTKVKTGRRMKYTFPSDLEALHAGYGLGKNNFDIVITHFANMSVVQSKYFLLTTLKMDSELNKIFNW